MKQAVDPSSQLSVPTLQRPSCVSGKNTKEVKCLLAHREHFGREASQNGTVVGWSMQHTTVNCRRCLQTTSVSCGVQIHPGANQNRVVAFYISADHEIHNVSTEASRLLTPLQWYCSLVCRVGGSASRHLYRLCADRTVATCAQNSLSPLWRLMCSLICTKTSG